MFIDLRVFLFNKMFMLCWFTQIESICIQREHKMWYDDDSALISDISSLASASFNHLIFGECVLHANTVGEGVLSIPLYAPILCVFVGFLSLSVSRLHLFLLPSPVAGDHR